LSKAVLSRTRRPTAGFTLVEALVALAIVAVSLVAIGTVMGSTARGARQLEQHVELVQAAYDALWLSFPSRAPPPSNIQSGQSMQHAWRADLEPFAVDFGAPSGEVLWVPQKVRLRVQSSSGAIVNLETVRLFRRRSE
jgi:general secretion pathway protein I